MALLWAADRYATAPHSLGRKTKGPIKLRHVLLATALSAGVVIFWGGYNAVAYERNTGLQIPAAAQRAFVLGVLAATGILLWLFSGMRRRSQKLAAPVPKAPTIPEASKAPATLDARLMPYVHAEDFVGLQAALLQVKVHQLSESELASWYAWQCLLEARTGQLISSGAIAREGLQRFPEEVRLWFSLGYSLESQGRAEEAFAAWSHVHIAPHFDAHALWQLTQFGYLWDNHAAMFAVLDELFAVYKTLVSVSRDYVGFCRLPLYEDVFSTYAAAAIETHNLDQASEVLAKHTAAFSLKDEVSMQRLLLDAHRTGDWQQVAAARDASCSEDYQNLREAVIQSRQRPTQAAAFAVLDAVRLMDLSSMLHESIRTLAKAEASARFGCTNDAERLLEDFFATQPLMLEPHHAFALGFLRYQGTLKPRLRERREALRAAG